MFCGKVTAINPANIEMTLLTFIIVSESLGYCCYCLFPNQISVIYNQLSQTVFVTLLLYC